jgi:hypothetical protein
VSEARRAWLARVALIGSALAVMATSRPEGWKVEASITGPLRAAPDHALELSIVTSHEPTIHASGAPKGYADARSTPCLVPFAPGSPLVCPLPPGAVLDDVEIHGSCGGCKNGCPAPKGAYVTVTTRDAPVAKDSTSSRMSAELPFHDKKWIATRFEVIVQGAPLIQVELSVLDASSGAKLFDETQACAHSASAPAGSGLCYFTVMDDSIPAPKTKVNVVAEATGWETCAAEPCAAKKTLRIDSLGFAK